MKIRYDAKADALYIEFKKGKVAKTKHIDEDVSIDYDKQGKVAGIEILSARERILKGKHTVSIDVENIVSV